MKIKRLAFVITLCVIISQNCFAVASNLNKNTCSLVGKKVYVSGKIYTCYKKKSRKIWSKGKDLISLTTNDNKEIYPKSNSVYIQMQKLISGLEVTSNLNLEPILILKQENVGDDGFYFDDLKYSVSDSLHFMNQIGIKLRNEETQIIVGRSDSWFKNYLSSMCTNDFLPSQIGSGGAFNCLPSNKKHVVLNIAGVISRKFHFVDPKLDLSKLVISPATYIDFATQAPHELFHVYQGDIWDKKIIINKDVPLWFVEGGATVFGLAVSTLHSRQLVTYSDVKNIQLRNMPSNILEKCDKSIQEMDLTPGQGCQYFQGAIAVELLLVNHGGWETLIKLTEGLSGNGFESDFMRIVGIPLNKFYEEIDSFSKEIGFAKSS